jgi:hypothetical protein
MNEDDARQCLALWNAAVDAGQIDLDQYPEIGLSMGTSDFERWFAWFGWDDGTENDIAVTVREFNESLNGFLKTAARP